MPAVTWKINNLYISNEFRDLARCFPGKRLKVFIGFI